MSIIPYLRYIHVFMLTAGTYALLLLQVHMQDHAHVQYVVWL